MYREDIEKLFNQDIREKKRTGSGAFHMRGKGVRHGFNGALRTPYHFMKTKEKNKLNSEVRTYNMYETILTRAEFELKDTETQKLMLTRWRELYPNTKIMEEMGVSNNAAFAKIVNGLGIQKKREWSRKPNKQLEEALSYAEQRKENKQMSYSDFNEAVDSPSPSIYYLEDTQKVDAIYKVEPKPESIGLELNFNGEYKADHISKILTKLQLMLEDEESTFKVTLSVKEVTE